MSRHVIVGGGAVGSATAQLLTELGHEVRVVSRSGRGPAAPGVELVAADATDAEALTRLTAGADVLYNCANPAYHRWLVDWPPLAAALRTAAEQTGAVLATTGNLYGYGPVDGVIDDQTPLAATHPKLAMRAAMWRDDLAAHEAGRLRTTEVRGSDYIESNGLLSFALATPLLAGKRAYTPTPLDVPHSWTSIADVARTLVTVATDERGWGKAWHVPTNPALTVRELATQFTEAAHAPSPKLTTIPSVVMRSIGLFSPMVRELRTTRYQFSRPFILDSTTTTRTFGLEPTPMADALRAAVTAARSEPVAAG